MTTQQTTKQLNTGFWSLRNKDLPLNETGRSFCLRGHIIRKREPIEKRANGANHGQFDCADMRMWLAFRKVACRMHLIWFDGMMRHGMTFAAPAGPVYAACSNAAWPPPPVALQFLRRRAQINHQPRRTTRATPALFLQSSIG